MTVKLVAYRSIVGNLGYLDPQAWLLPACDIAVLPSLWREGLSRGIIEAMIGGAVQIVTDSGGSPELFIDGKSGFVVPPAITTAEMCDVSRRALYIVIKPGSLTLMPD